MTDELDKNQNDSDDLNRDVPPSDPIGGKELGLAGTIAKTFINSPVTPMLLIATLLIGLSGLIFTPRQEDPQISVPMIDIFVSYPGTSASQVESLVTDPLERLMDEIPGVRHTFSATQRGNAIVTVQFYVGENLGESIVKVTDKISSNMDKMPPDVLPPLVKPVAIDDVPAVAVTLWSKEVDDSTLRILGNDVLQELGQVKNTGKGFVVAGRADQIRVEVLPERLAGYGISLQQVAGAIQVANTQKNVGAVEAGSKSFTVYSGSFLRTASDIERLVVGMNQGSPVFMRDVAEVYHGPEDARNISSFYAGPAYEGIERPVGDPAVTVAIAKKEGANGVTVSKAILKKLEELKGTIIPDNVYVEITRDYGKSANDKVNELLSAMFEATAAVAVLCLIGLGFRAAFVVVTVIPVVILITIWWAWMVDYTIDRVSMFALIFAIGILVDDATVVVENIFRHWLIKGRTTLPDAVDAVREVGNPTILATFTIIAALLPMGWVSGMMGPYMRPIPVMGASAMFFSLIAAFIFTPWFAVRVRPQLDALKKAEKREEKTRKFVAAIYRPLIMPLVNSRRLGIFFLVGVIVVTAMTMLLFYPTQWVAVKMLPFDNKPEFSVIINMPEGTAMPVTANVANDLAVALNEMPEVKAIQTYAGTAQPFNFNGMVRHYYLRQQPWHGELLVLLKEKHDREKSSHQIAEEARALLTPIAKKAGGRIAIVEMPPGPPVLQTVVAEIHGPDADTRREVAAKMTEFFEQAEGVVDVDNMMNEPSLHWRFEVNREKAIRRGVTVDSINGTLAMAMGGYKLGDVKRASVIEPTFIVIQVPMATRSQVNQLSNLPMVTADGTIIPLGELGRFILEENEPVIWHKDLRNVEFVTGEMEGRLGAPIYGMFNVEEFTDQYTTPDGVIMEGMPMNLIGPPGTDTKSGFEWTGEWTVTFETFRDMGLAFMAALVLIYGLIVWEFRDFALAGLIMSPIPLTMIGIVPGHWFHGAEFTATSMIGMIALGGIIVRQSILIVEFVKIEVAKGIPVREAAVNGAEIRMRPIFITSLTLMAGAFAILNDPIFNGMAISLLWGAGVGTIMAVIVIPLGCISVRENFYYVESASGERTISEKFAEIEGEAPDQLNSAESEYKTPLWMKVYGVIVGIFGWIFVIGQMIFNILRMLFGMVMGMFGSDSTPPAPPTPPPAAPSSPPPAPPAAPAPVRTDDKSEPGAENKSEEKPAASKKVAAKKPAVKKAPVKKEAPKKAAVKKVAVKKQAIDKKETPEAAAVETPEPVKAEPIITTETKEVPVKEVPVKEPPVKNVEVKKKAITKKVAKKKATNKVVADKLAVKKITVKKAPSKKTSPGGRRGIRLKDET
jgi:multidrug efflux pump subunit AcrB